MTAASKRGPGRPSLGAAARTVMVGIRLTPSEHIALVDMANQAGVTSSDFARTLVLNGTCRVPRARRRP
jgi:hypothetical protein